MKLKSHIILIGMPGSGKTSFGRDLSQSLNVEFYDTDEYIEEREKKSIPDIFQNEGEDSFRRYETESLKEVLKKCPGVISTGGGIIKSPENREIMKQSGTVVFIDRPLGEIFSDLDTDSRPLLMENREKLYKLYDERYDLYREAAKYKIINDKDYYEVLDEILNTVETAMEGEK